MANNIMPTAQGNHESLYERDYYTWALRQANALKKHRVELLDWENLAEEVGDLARSERRELRNRLKVPGFQPVPGSQLDQIDGGQDGHSHAYGCSDAVVASGGLPKAEVKALVDAAM